MKHKKLEISYPSHIAEATEGVIHRKETSGKKSDLLDVEFTVPPTGASQEPASVPFHQLIRFSTRWERVLMGVAALSTVGSAACQPLNTYFFGQLAGVMVEYGSQLAGANHSEQAVDVLLDGVTDFAKKVGGVGAAMFVCTYVSISLFNYVALRQIHRIRAVYLRSVLQQDVGWYDLNQSGDFASRMSEDLLRLEEGLGEKVTMFLHLVLGFLGSVGLALFRGWELALVCMVSMPITLVAMSLVAVISSRLAKRELLQYAHAAAIAEEVLSSIRTVVAFGGQRKEADRYERDLVAARGLNVRRNLCTGLGFGLLWFFIYAGYALAFYYGVTLVMRERGYDEDDRVYTPATMVTVSTARYRRM